MNISILIRIHRMLLLHHRARTRRPRNLGRIHSREPSLLIPIAIAIPIQRIASLRFSAFFLRLCYEFAEEFRFGGGRRTGF